MLVGGRWYGRNGDEVVIWRGFVPRIHLRSWYTSQARGSPRVCFVG